MKLMVGILMLIGLVFSTYAQDQYIVVNKEGESPVASATRHGIKPIKVYDTVLNGYVAKLSSSKLREVQQDPATKYIDSDGYVYPATVQDNVDWSLAQINNRSIIFSTTYSYEYFNTGRGVNVYILDSGVLTNHPDFGGRAKEVWTIRKGRNNPDQSQCTGHGTLVAGVAGGTVTGVAKEVNLLSVTMTQCTTGVAYVSDLINAIQFVARQKGTKIANISYAGDFQQSVYDALEAGYQKGVVWILAAGNIGVDACTQTPAATPDALTISGVDNRGYDDGFNGGQDPNWTGFNYGTCVDAFASHVSWTDWYEMGTGTPHTGDVFGGTSFSAPHAAGIAALYLELHPTASAPEVINGVLSQATVGILHINGAGSPNVLLYSKVQ